MFTAPFLLFFLLKKVLKVIFGCTPAEGVTELIDGETIDPNNFTIRQPISSLVIYIVISVFLLFILGVNIWMWIDYDFRLNNLIATLMFLPIGLLGPFLIVIWFRWKLTVKGDKMTFTSYFGRKKSFTFGDITRAKQGVNKTKMGTIMTMTAYHEKEKLFYVMDNCPGYKVLIQRLKDAGVKIEW